MSAPFLSSFSCVFCLPSLSLGTSPRGTAVHERDSFLLFLTSHLSRARVRRTAAFGTYSTLCLRAHNSLETICPILYFALSPITLDGIFTIAAASYATPCINISRLKIHVLYTEVPHMLSENVAGNFALRGSVKCTEIPNG